MKKIITILLTSSFLFLSLFFIFLTRFFVNFSYSINHQPKELIKKLTSSYQQSQNLPTSLNFLLLGLDQRDDWLEKTSVTDTILFLSLNLSNQQIHLISIPRDLWVQESMSKINAIYPQAKETEKDYLSSIQKKFSNLTGQKIDGILIIKTDSFTQIPALVGPINVYLENAFTDDQYPDPCYIKDPQKCPNPYMTINFDQGWNKLDENNITPFIKSRKNADTATNGGTDIGRSQRQQLLIEALFTKIKDNNFIFKPDNISKLYNFWKSQTDSNITDEFLLSILFNLKKGIFKLDLKKHQIPIGLDKFDESGVIYHPDYFTNKAWVFLPSQNDITKLQDFISQSIK